MGLADTAEPAQKFWSIMTCHWAGQVPFEPLSLRHRMDCPAGPRGSHIQVQQQASAQQLHAPPEDGQCPGAGVRGTHSGFPHVTASGARRAGAMGAGFRGGAVAAERREPESAQGTGCGCSGRQRGSPRASVDTALLARGSLPGGQGVLWKEAPLHAAPALHVPKQLCVGAPHQTETGGVTPPSPPRSSKHRKCSRRVSSA